jgi:hypothetical protein
MFDSDGKIFVAVAVISLILLGLAVFMFYLEYRIGRSEKKLSELEGRQGKSWPEGSNETGPGALKPNREH